MNFFIVSLLLNCKRILSRPSNLAALCLMPVCALLAAAFLGSGQPLAQINVGLLYNESDAASRLVADRMAAATGVGLTRFSPSGEPDMERMIVKGQLECGYILDNELTKRLEDGRLEGVVVILKTPNAVADAIVNEMLYAALIEAASPYITALSIADGMGKDYDAALTAAAEGIAGYESGGTFVKPKYEYVNSGPNTTENIPSPLTARLPKGLTALFIFISIMFLLPMFIEEKKNRALAALGLAGRCAYRLSVFAAMFLTTACFGALSLLAAQAANPAASLDLPRELLALSLYTSGLSMTGLLIICALNSAEVIYGGFIFMALACLLFGGVLVDLGEISPALAAVSRLFLSSHYMNGSLPAMAVWLAVSAALAFLAALAEIHIPPPLKGLLKI